MERDFYTLVLALARAPVILGSWVLPWLSLKRIFLSKLLFVCPVNKTRYPAMERIQTPSEWVLGWHVGRF